MKNQARNMITAILVGLSAQLAGAATIAHWRFEDGTNGVEHVGDKDDWYQDLSGNGNHLSSWFDQSRPTATNERSFSSVPLSMPVSKVFIVDLPGLKIVIVPSLPKAQSVSSAPIAI